MAERRRHDSRFRFVEPRATCQAEVIEEATIATTRRACLEQLLEAFRDIADRDDIHQAAERLVLVQEWIACEAARAAADPIFAPLPLAS